MAEAAKKPSPFAAVWKSMTRMLNIVQGMREVHDQRLGNIEDRLSRLDGGNARVEAAGFAKEQIVARRRKDSEQT